VNIPITNKGEVYNTLAAISIASLATLSFEITLVRIFSISLWYHFAFMVVSIAMLGIGASGTILSLAPGIRRKEALPYFSLGLGMSMPLSFLLTNSIPFDPARLVWDRIQIIYISLLYLLHSLPFLFFGLVMATSFSVIRGSSGLIYGADLIGAGIGSVSTLFLLHIVGPEKIVFIMSCASLLAIFLCGNPSLKTLSFLFLCINIAVIYADPSVIKPRISPYKPLPVALKYPGAELLKTYYSPFSRVDVFRSPAVRFAPGMSLKYLEDIPWQLGLSVDAGNINAITFYSDKEELEFLGYLPSGLAYKLSDRRDALILEPLGGLSVLMAEYYGYEEVYKVEPDGTLIEAVRDFMPDIYDEKTYIRMGRSWLASSGRFFSLIDISSIGTMPTASYGFSEDYRFTVEAFEEYLKHLRHDGFLTVTVFIIPPPRSELRITNSIIRALEKLGTDDPSLHLAVIRSWGTITIIAKKSRLSLRDINIVKKFALKRGFDLVYYPGIKMNETNQFIRMTDNIYAESFNKLIRTGSRNSFNKSYLFDINPVYDDKPFHQYYLKLGKLKEIYRLMGRKWQFFIEEGYLLPAIFLQVSLLTILLVTLPAIKLKGKGGINLLYFGFLGIAFMFVEISLIQRMILYLENPTHAAAVVIFSILLGSGTGSISFQHFNRLKQPGTVIAVSVLILLYSFLLPVTLSKIVYLSLNMRFFLVFVILIPAGFLMGIPFPLGLSILEREKPEFIPWAWAVNGSVSVLASILAIMMALSAGFRAVMITGGFVYLSAFFLLKRSTKGAR
jgi:hypothetical protein